MSLENDYSFWCRICLYCTLILQYLGNLNIKKHNMKKDFINNWMIVWYLLMMSGFQLWSTIAAPSVSPVKRNIQQEFSSISAMINMSNKRIIEIIIIKKKIYSTFIYQNIFQVQEKHYIKCKYGWIFYIYLNINIFKCTFKNILLEKYLHIIFNIFYQIYIFLIFKYIYNKI